jgi:hypothetical protein
MGTSSQGDEFCYGNVVTVSRKNFIKIYYENCHLCNKIWKRVLLVMYHVYIYYDTNLSTCFPGNN